MESPDKGHFGSNINSVHFVPCRGIVLFRRFYLYYFGTGINFGGLQVCLSKRDYQYIVPSSECPLSETSLYFNCCRVGSSAMTCQVMRSQVSLCVNACLKQLSQVWVGESLGFSEVPIDMHSLRKVITYHKTTIKKKY